MAPTRRSLRGSARRTPARVSSRTAPASSMPVRATAARPAALGRSPGAACAATSSPSSRSLVFFLIVICCLLAPVWANHVAHTGPNTTHTAGETPRGRRSQGSRRTERQSDRPAVVRRRRQVLPRRRRPPRPRRDGPPALRRPRLALHRHRRGDHHHDPRGRLRPPLRLLRRLHRHLDLAGHGRDLGLPGGPPGDRARHRARRRRPRDRADTPEVELPLDPDLDHRLRLHALYGETLARRSLRPARERVHRGGGGPGRRALSGSCSSSCCRT